MSSFLDQPRSDARVRRTQRQRVEELAQRLLWAAAELIAEQGYERVTAAEIGERAGYSRAMVRDRYGSKEALIEALFHMEFEPRLAVIWDRSQTGLERILAQINGLEQLGAEPELARSFFVLTFETVAPVTALRPWFRDYFDRFEAQMVEHLLAGEHDGSIRRGLDREMEARQFVSHGLGIAFRRTLDWEGFDFFGELDRWRSWLRRRYAA